MLRVLIVDDDESMREVLVEYLRSRGHSVIGAGGYREAMETLAAGDIGAMVLDWNLPDGSGLEFCLSARGSGFQGPVLFLTARTDLESAVSGFEAGATHFLVKPVPLPLLDAKLQSALRNLRSRQLGAKEIPIGDGYFDSRKSCVRRGDREWSLKPKQAGILRLLLLNDGQPVSREEILNGVWKSRRLPGPRTVDNFVGSLRAVLAGIFGETVRIGARPGQGYYVETVPRGR